MFCPHCGQERISQDTNFCSRCGYLLTGTAELLALGGAMPNRANVGGQSPRTRGIKQGVFILLLTFLIVPLVAILSVTIKAPPVFVAISAITLFIGGLLRIAYAALFESSVAGSPMLGEHSTAAASGLIAGTQNQARLPTGQPQPVSSFTPPSTGKWRDTNELDPSSVTESTTRLLHKSE